MIYKTLALGASLVTLSGCFSTTIANPDQYKPVSLTKAAILPTENQLANQPYKVVVFDIDDSAVKLAREAGVGKPLAQELMRNINQSNADIVDQAGLEGLKKAIDSRKTGYQGPLPVDYAITGKISVAKYTTKFYPATYNKDKDGKPYTTSPSCVYSTLVQGNIQIYDVNSLRVAHQFAISGGEQTSENVAVNQSSACRKLGHDEILSMISASGVSAAHREDVQVKNFFRPKGYVLEKRVKGDESIFKISIGKSSGVVKDQDAKFYTMKEDKDPATGNVSVVQNELGEGTVTDKVQDGYAWVLIEDKDIASQIKYGDVVKVVYSKSFWENLTNRSFSN